jgi:hypothetical protein
LAHSTNTLHEGSPRRRCGFGHFAVGFIDHLAFEADGAAAFGFGGLAVGGQDAFGAGVGGGSGEWLRLGVSIWLR